MKVKNKANEDTPKSVYAARVEPATVAMPDVSIECISDIVVSFNTGRIANAASVYWYTIF